MSRGRKSVDKEEIYGIKLSSVKLNEVNVASNMMLLISRYCKYLFFSQFNYKRTLKKVNNINISLGDTISKE